MQTVTASAQGMVSQANKWREAKERERTPDWSSYVRRFSNLLHIIPRERFLHLSFDFRSGLGGFNTTVDAISMSSHHGEQDDDEKTTQRQSRAAAAANRRPK